MGTQGAGGVCGARQGVDTGLPTEHWPGAGAQGSWPLSVSSPSLGASTMRGSLGTASSEPLEGCFLCLLLLPGSDGTQGQWEQVAGLGGHRSPVTLPARLGRGAGGSVLHPMTPTDLSALPVRRDPTLLSTARGVHIPL